MEEVNCGEVGRRGVWEEHVLREATERFMAVPDSLCWILKSQW